MNKKEFKQLLQDGAAVKDYLPLVFNTYEQANILPWPKTVRGSEDEVIYYASNEDTPDPSDKNMDEDEIEDVLNNTYIVNDIIEAAGYNIRLAHDIYCNLSWQSPDTERASIEDATDEDEAKRDYGESWKSIHDREEAPNIPFLVTHTRTGRCDGEILVYGRSEDEIRVWLEDFHLKPDDEIIMIVPYDDSHGNPKGIPTYNLPHGWLAY